MALDNWRWIGFACGDNSTRYVSIPDVPQGATIVSVHFCIARKAGTAPGSPDALLDATLTAAPGTNGQIIDTGSSGIGMVRLDLTPTNTRALPPGVPCAVDIQSTLSTGYADTHLSGLIQASAPAITR